MRQVRSLLAVTLTLLFVGLSFNAYACLLPLGGASPSAMENGCPSQENQPARQLCDSFTTLGVQAAPQADAPTIHRAICHEDSVSTVQFLDLSLSASRVHHRSTDTAPQNLLVGISVLRL